MSPTLSPAPVRTYSYTDSALCEKVSVGWKGPGKKNAALVALIVAIEHELAADSSWYDKALIQAGVKTTVWVTKNVGGVERAVRANFEAGRLPNAAKLVANLRQSLTKIVEDLKQGGA